MYGCERGGGTPGLWRHLLAAGCFAAEAKSGEMPIWANQMFADT
jgi:hypothetical protein